MRHKVVSIALLALVAVLVIASPVLAYIYRATYTVTENASVSYDMLGAVTDNAVANQWMADNGFFNSTANDTRVETLGGLIKPHMMADNKTFAGIPVPANSQTNLYFTTGNSELDAFYTIPGYDGYIAITDDSDLELSDNFIVEVKGWIDTDNGSEKNLILKSGAFRIVVGADGEISAMIQGDAWVQRAPQLNAQTYINALVVYNGQLYGSTSAGGRLFQWNDNNAWVQVAPQLGGATTINCLAVYDGKLYGGTNAIGNLYEWNGVDAWVSVAPQLGAETDINCLAVYNGKLYGGTGALGNLYEWNGVDAWAQVAPQLGAITFIRSLAVYNGKLYGGTNITGELYEWNDVNAWVQKAPQLGAETDIWALEVYKGQLYGGTGSLGNLYMWDDANLWVQKAPQLGAEDGILSLQVYNGHLYGGTRSTALLLEWDDINAWTQVCAQLGAETRLLSLTVYDNKLYGGTGILTGELYEWEIDAEVTATGVTSGEHTVTVTGNATGFCIYIDGILEDVGSFPITGGANWVEKAPQLAPATRIESLETYKGKLYGGAFNNSNLYEWNGVNAWVSVAGQAGGTETHIYDLAVYNDKLYGVTEPNGELYEWNDVNAWVLKAPTLDADIVVFSLAVYNGKLYGGTGQNARLYEWNDVDAWVQVAPQLGAEVQIKSLAVYNDKLYGGTGFAAGELYEWNGVDAWVLKAPQLGGATSIFSLAVYNDKLYEGVGGNGNLYEWNGVDAWVSVAPQLGAETGIYSLAVYNGKLYGGTASLGNLYEWNGTNAWTQVAPQLGAEIYIYDLEVYNGKLYGSTRDLAKLYEWDAVLPSPLVPDNANDWVLIENNVMPYMEYYKHTVGGNLIAWYEPVAMIVGTELPDRQGGDEPGIFSWGSNPAGVSVALGGLVSSSQPAPGLAIEDPTPDIMPEAEVTDWYVEPDVAGILLTFPLRPFVTILSDNTNMTESQAWQLLGTAFVLMVAVGVARVVRGHYLIAGIATGAAILTLVVLTIYPMWTLILMVATVLAGMIAERTHSL